MHNIRLRGLNKQSGLWAYGDHIRQDDSGNTILYNSQDIGFIIKRGTIGKYVGYKDKNENDVYEGDIWRILTGYSHSKGIRKPSYKIGVVTLHTDGAYIGRSALWANGGMFCHEQGEIVGSIHLLIHEAHWNVNLS